MDWKIYYSDGSTFTSEDGSPEAAPPLRVQVIAQANPSVGRVLVHGGDYYWFYEGEWFAGDIAGAYSFLITSGLLHQGRRFSDPCAMLDWMISTGQLKLGEYLRGDRFLEIYNQADADPDLPGRTAYHPLEKRV